MASLDNEPHDRHQPERRHDVNFSWPWPCPILTCYLASGIAEDHKALIRRLLDHPGMAEAWPWACARYTSPLPLLQGVRGCWNHTLRYYTMGERTVLFTTAKDEARPLEAVARAARELKLLLRLNHVWLAEEHDRLGDQLGDLARKAAALAAYFAASHPSPRTSTSPARHPRRKTLNRLLARLLYRGNPYTSTDRRHIGILTEACLGPDLDCPAPVTVRMVKEDLRGVDLTLGDSVLLD